MSILIKGMEMPKNCYECYFCTYGYCAHLDRYITNSQEIDKDCPLIKLPPHGRLIDADDMIEELTPSDEDENDGAKLILSVFLEVLKAAPTIIEAEGEE